ncbi:MAG: ribosome maturation factor [Bacteroidetes bacterium]|nr:ribosome maturation factor [Bacteroidota bacterium]
MTADTAIQTIENLVTPLLDSDIFLVGIKIKPTNNFKVYLDADSGLAIEKCIKINRALYKKIEETGLYPDGDFSLEVSSPGVDEPLKLLRQYKKNTGRNVEITMLDDSHKEGILKDVTEDTITLEQTTGKGKKAVTANPVIAFSDIKQTKVLIKF